jgi:hypothetical protein
MARIAPRWAPWTPSAASRCWRRAPARRASPRPGCRRTIARAVAASPRAGSTRWSSSRAYDPASAAPPVRGPEIARTQPGFRAAHESEALLARCHAEHAAAPRTVLPRSQRHAVHREERGELRTWMIDTRLRSHEAYACSHGALRRPVRGRQSKPVRLLPLPIPEAPRRSTPRRARDARRVGRARRAPIRGALYAANADMAGRCFGLRQDFLVVSRRNAEAGPSQLAARLARLGAHPAGLLATAPDRPRAGGARDGERRCAAERGSSARTGSPRHFLAPVAAYEDARMRATSW